MKLITEMLEDVRCLTEDVAGQGKKYYIFVIVDDYSRYILRLQLFDHCPTTKELTSVFKFKLNEVKPEMIDWRVREERNEIGELTLRPARESINAIKALPVYCFDCDKLDSLATFM